MCSLLSTQAAAEAPEANGQVINVGCGEEISLRDLAGLLLGAMGDPIVPDFGALAYRPTEIWRMYCDSTRARESLGWRPKVTIEQGLKLTIDWYRTFLREHGELPAN